MWPWEHLVFGYVLYSTYTHVVQRQSPEAGPTVALSLAAVFPDLIDKPLAWEFGVFSTGYALGHSVFFAIPLAVAVLVFTDRSPIGVAFVLGYASHLLGDVSVRRGEILIEHFFWPLMVEPSLDHGGLDAGVRYYLEDYFTTLITLDPTPGALIQLALFFAAVALWLADGMPPLRSVVTVIGSRLRSKTDAK